MEHLGEWSIILFYLRLISAISDVISFGKKVFFVDSLQTEKDKQDQDVRGLC